ncbi:Transcriptional regulator, RHH [Saccharolobus shibatae B12]|uniref:Transcriptional regulator, RHH n=1 Tax=Saccharolobus shibatae (strain ATCC 51178 / DSM 5389 / JCM 8931 / NBRC 15437 / B12) TaxID=523848 RepID=A0A8F5BM24_SACSH|nr:hypothetical protein [Saccharolobus shibatae]QXJ27817.1 Transcriptional regulator, RHH [Saccharolobus shibatae B12]
MDSKVKEKTVSKTIRFLPEDDELLEKLRIYYGVRTQVDTLRILIREKARSLGIFTT